MAFTFFFFFSGNECLVSHDGYFAGCNILLNSGLASHGGGDNQGLSKAGCMVTALLVCPGSTFLDIDWSPAWTPINLTQFQRQFRPILIALAKAVDTNFWV